MKYNARKMDASVAGNYQEIGRSYDDPCVYCGSVSISYDHVPPISYASRMSAMLIAVTKLKKYPACAECNSILGAATVTSLPQRQAMVRKKLAQKYRKILGTPEWTEEELAQVSDALATDIRRHARIAA